MGNKPSYPTEEQWNTHCQNITKKCDEIESRMEITEEQCLDELFNKSTNYLEKCNNPSLIQRIFSNKECVNARNDLMKFFYETIKTSYKNEKRICSIKEIKQYL